MGDALGAIFGSGQRQSQTTQADPTSQSLNRMREEQLGTLFSGAGNNAFWSFGQPGGDAYQADPRVNELLNLSMGALRGTGSGDTESNIQQSNFNFDDYLARGSDRGLYEHGIGGLEGDYTSANNLREAQAANARAGVDRAYNEGISRRDTDYANARGDVDNRYLNYKASNEGQLQDALTRSQRNYGNATDAAKGYISEIATPEIMQQMVLQGLEGGGAVPAAIARAAAEVGTPLAQQFMSEQAGLSQAGMGNQASLGQQALGVQGELANTGQSVGGQLSSNRQGLLAGLSEADIAALSNLNNILMQGRTGLTGQQMGNEASFAQTLPGAQDTFSTMSGRQNLLRAQADATRAQAGATTAQAASSLFPLADYSRGLRESDYLRRQGVATTGFTGIPFTPGQTSNQKQSSQPLFNFFGQG